MLLIFCSKKIDAVAGSEYKCTTCNNKNITPTLRYKLKVEISDSTSTLVATFWDELCVNLFGKSIAGFLSSGELNGEHDDFQEKGEDEDGDGDGDGGEEEY
ncbi:hypothetical protein OROGR_004773 [Orobanche gracilis]